MVKADDKILELLDETDLMLTPKVIGRNLNYTGSYVNERLRKMQEKDMVERHNGERSALYTIEYLGKAYLRGDIDASELED